MVLGAPPVSTATATALAKVTADVAALMKLPLRRKSDGSLVTALATLNTDVGALAGLLAIEAPGQVSGAIPGNPLVGVL